MPDYAFYCRRCWQEFDDPAGHNSGSWLKTNTGRYDDVNDYKRLCRSCHVKMDGTITNIRKMRHATA